MKSAVVFLNVSLTLLLSLVFSELSPANEKEFACGPVVSPESVGLDSDKLSKIDETIKRWIEDGKVAGCSVMVIRKDKVAYFQTFGNRDLEKELPVERDSIFRIYSMTKPITSIAALQLVEQNKLGLDDPVSEYIPSFQSMTVLTEEGEVPARREITVRDLMSHTSGLTYGFFGDTEVDMEYRKKGILIMDRDLEQMCDKLCSIPLLHQPGSQFHYSASTDVLGRVVEVASGQSLREYFDANIFKPLGMKDSYFTLPFPKQERLCQMYKPGPQKTGLEVCPQWESMRFVASNNAFFSGGGGLCSTIDDYGLFARMLATEGKSGESTLINKATLDQAFSNQLDRIDKPGGNFRFGLGFRISDRGKSGTDYGWGGAAGTRFWSNPEKKMVVLFMVQIKPTPQKFGEKIRDIAYSALQE